MEKYLWKFMLVLASAFFAASGVLSQTENPVANEEVFIRDSWENSVPNVAQSEEEKVLNQERRFEEAGLVIAAARITRQEVQGRNPAAVTPEEEAENQQWMQEFENIFAE